MILAGSPIPRRRRFPLPGGFSRVAGLLEGPADSLPAGLPGPLAALPVLLAVLPVLLVAPTAGWAQDPFVLDTLQVAVESRVAPGVGAVQVLEGDEIRALPVRNVEEALRWATGVHFQPRSGAQADVSIRGSSFEQVLVLVDGVRMSDPQSGHFDLDLAVPLERVERIEILRGPASAVYGADAFGGVINVVTRDGRRGSRSVTRVEGGSDGTWALAVDSQGEVGRWTVGAGISRDASDGHREGTDYEVLRMTSRTAGPLGVGRALVDVGYARRDFGAASFYAPFSSYEETRTLTTSARWVGRVSNLLTLEPRLSYREHDDDFVLERDEPDFFRNVHDSRQLTAELEGRIPVGATGALSFGAEWARESLESTNLGDREQEWRAGFAEVAFRRRAVQLQAGLRYDDRDDVGDFLSPSASLRWNAAPRLALRGGWGRSFRAPTWTERYYTDPANIGTPDLAVERGWSAEAALEYQLDRGELSVTAFRREAENLIDWARPDGSDDSVPWRTRNVLEARYDGVEVVVSRSFENGVSLNASGSWLTQDAGGEAGFFSKYALRPIHRELVARAILPLADDARLTVSAADRTRLGGGGGTLLDLRLTLPTEDAQFFVDVLNVTEADYADVTGLPIPGRRFLVGVRGTF